MCLFVRDYSGSRNFTSRTCCRRNREDRYNRTWNLEVSFVIENLATVSRYDAYCFCNVHRAAATESYDARRAAFVVEGSRFCNDGSCRIRLYFQISRALEAGLFNDILNLLYDTDLFQTVVRDEEYVVEIVFFHDVRQLLESADAEFDILRNHKAEIFHFFLLFFRLCALLYGIKNSINQTCKGVRPILV